METQGAEGGQLARTESAAKRARRREWQRTLDEGREWLRGWRME